MLDPPQLPERGVGRKNNREGGGKSNSGDSQLAVMGKEGGEKRTGE